MSTTPVRYGDLLRLYDDAPPAPKDPWMDVREAAKVLGIGAATIYKAVKDGTCASTYQIRYVKFGSRVRINRMDVEHAAGRALGAPRT